MNVVEQASTDLKKSYKITIPNKDIEAQADQRLNVIGASVSKPGFRKGKVPVAILRKDYGQRAWAEAAEGAIQQAADQIINDNKLKPAMQPQIEVETFEPGKDVVITMDIEVTPPIKLMDLAKIEVTRRVVAGDKDAVEDTINNVRKQQKTLTDAPEGTKAALGDTLVIDFEGDAEGVGKLPGMKGEGAQLELGSNSFIPGFEDQLVGAKAGDTVDVKVTFPEAYHAEELSGKNATFVTKVHAVKKAELPELNDEFAQTLGLASMDALRELVEKDVNAELERLGHLATKRELLDVLDEHHVFDVPQGLIDAEYKEIERQSPNASEDEKAELKAIAERRVRLGLVLTEIGEKNGVTVSPEELRAAAINEARKYPGQEAQIFEMFQKRPELLTRLRAPVFEEKVVNLVIEKAKVTDKTVTREELIKYLEEADTYQKPGEKKAAKKTAAKK